MLKKFKIDYDVENDSLFLYRGQSRGGVELGNLIFDFDANNNLVGLEICNASSLLQTLSVSDEVKLSKKMLQKIRECRIDVRVKDSLLLLKVYLYFENNEQLVAPIQIPTIHEHTPLGAET